jgi:hypothetical protein
VLSTILLAACGSDGGNGYSLDVGSDDGGSGLFQGGEGGGPTPLAAHIEENQLTVSFITVGCAGSCADVVAVASGGNPPYSFAWENGSTNPARHVCPTSTTSYAVAVADTSVATTGELAQPAQTARASLTANVLSCPDGGTTADAGLLSYADCDSLAAGFSPVGANPNGAWSYGWSSTVGAAFKLYPTFLAQELDAGAYNTNGFPGVAQWFDVSNGQVGTTGPVPDIQFNPSATPAYPGTGNFTGNSWVVEPGQVVMATPTVGSAASIARWTAAREGTFGVVATFASAANAPFTQAADTRVQQNGVDLPSGAGAITSTATSFSFSATVSVSVGDAVDFVVAPGSAPIYHAISVDAKVCGAGARDGG